MLHEYLRVIRYNISINNRPKGDVVAGWLDVLIHQLLVMFSLKAQHELHCVLQVAAYLPGQHPGVLGWLKTDGPAGQSCAALSDSSLEQAWRQKQQHKNDNLELCLITYTEQTCNVMASKPTHMLTQLQLNEKEKGRASTTSI